MGKFLKVYTSILLISLASYASAQNSSDKEREKNVQHAVENMLIKLGPLEKEVETLTQRVDLLKDVDLAGSLNKSVDPNLRLLYAEAYLWVKNTQSALDNLYLVSMSNVSSLSAGEEKKLTKLLLDAWIQEDSNLSVRKYIGSYVKQSGSYLEEKLYQAFLTNDHIQDEDYRQLKKTVAKVTLPDDIKYLFSKVAIKFDDPDTAFKYLKELQDGPSYNARKYYLMGAIDAKRKDFKKAIEHFQRCLSAAGENPDQSVIADSAQMALARIYLSEKDLKNALKHYETLKSSSPFYSQALFEKSYAYYKMGEIPHSAEILDLLLLSPPDSPIYFDSLSMRIRGEGTAQGEIYKTSLNFYNDLISRLDYEEYKLRQLMGKYKGREYAVLDLIDDRSLPQDPRAIPSGLTVRMLIRNDSIKGLASIKKEIDSIYKALDEMSWAVETIKRAYRDNRLLLSLRNTIDWLDSRTAETLVLLVETTKLYSELIREMGMGVPAYSRKFVSSVRYSSPQEVSPQCSDILAMSKRNLDELFSINGSLSSMRSNISDINEMIYTNWKVIDGERERQAVAIKKKAREEFDHLSKQKLETRLFLSDAFNIDNSAKRKCSNLFFTETRDEISKAIVNFLKLKADTESSVRPLLDKDRLSNVEKLFEMIKNLSDIPERIEKFRRHLFTKEEAVVKREIPQINEIASQALNFKKELAKISRDFELRANPIVAAQMKKILDSFEFYKQDYSWGLIALNFEDKKKLRNKLKEIYLQKETEINRIENNYDLASHEK